MQNLVLYSKWSCPLPVTLLTLVSAIGGSAVVSHYKNHLIVFPIIPSCSEQPVYSVHPRVWVCLYSNCQMESSFASNPLSLSLCIYSGVCLFCPLIINPHHPHLTPFSFAHLSFTPSFIPSPSSIPSPSTHPPFLSTPSSLFLFTFLWLIIQQLEATSQPYVSENCHLTLLACIISSLLSAFNFARNLLAISVLFNSQTN